MNMYHVLVSSQQTMEGNKLGVSASRVSLGYFPCSVNRTSQLWSDIWASNRKCKLSVKPNISLSCNVMFPSVIRDKQSVLQFVKNFKPHVEGQQIRILLHGPEGAGKSSFINSVQSVLLGEMYTQALEDNIGHDSFTKKVRRTCVF